MKVRDLKTAIVFEALNEVVELAVLLYFPSIELRLINSFPRRLSLFCIQGIHYILANCILLKAFGHAMGK